MIRTKEVLGEHHVKMAMLRNVAIMNQITRPFIMRSTFCEGEGLVI